MKMLAAFAAWSAAAIAFTLGASIAAAQEDEAHVRATRLLGMEVRSNGNDVGEIEDLVVDLATAEARYAILSYGGWFGIADRLYAAPLSDLGLHHGEDEALVIRLDEAQLRRLPAFAADAWPQWPDTSYWDSVERRGEPTGAARARLLRQGARLSELLERRVLDVRGEEVGEVEDAIVDLAHQRVAYVVVSVEALPSATGPAVLQDERLVPLPLQAFRPPGFGRERPEALVLRVRESRLRALPGFEEDEWPDFNDSRFAAMVQRETERLLDDFSAAR